MLNPHGPALFWHGWELAHHPNISYMDEWRPLSWHLPVGQVFLASLLLLVPLLWWSPRRLSPLQVLLLVGFGWQTVAHARFFIWWTMVFVWAALPQLQAVLRRYPWLWSEDRSVPSLRKTVMAGLLVGVTLIWTPGAWWLLYGEAPRGTQRVVPLTPIPVAEYLKHQYQSCSDPRVLSRTVFASETLADYLLWDLRLDPPVRLCCYTHIHLFSVEQWYKCMEVKSAEPSWQQILDKWDVQFVVLEYDLYEQQEHRARGQPPGFSDLIDQIKAANDRWQVVPEVGAPFFVARRIRR